MQLDMEETSTCDLLNLCITLDDCLDSYLSRYLYYPPLLFFPVIFNIKKYTFHVNGLAESLGVSQITVCQFFPLID